MTVDRVFNVLVLCTGNSARSIMGEALFNFIGKGKFKAYSAGSHPAGQVNPFAIAQLEREGFPTDNLRSKSWDEFAVPGAPEMDIVITVCDRAASEACPVWPGQPITAHWSVEDPVEATGTPEQVRRAFTNALHLLQHRIGLLMALRIEALDRLVLETRVREIGKTS